jgi:hypothetical protein
VVEVLRPAHDAAQLTARRVASEDRLGRLGREIEQLKSNGPAGWQILGRGYSNLLILEAGYKIAKAEK